MQGLVQSDILATKSLVAVCVTKSIQSLNGQLPEIICYLNSDQIIYRKGLNNGPFLITGGVSHFKFSVNDLSSARQIPVKINDARLLNEVHHICTVFL